MHNISRHFCWKTRRLRFYDAAFGMRCCKRFGMLSTVIITKENLHMLEKLIDTLYNIPDIGKIHSFLPDYRGRGYLLEPSCITTDDYDRLPSMITSSCNITQYKTQAEWLKDSLPEYTKRTLIITL